MTTLAESRTEMTEMILPNETNNLGRALGGAVLHWMDICVAVSSTRFAARQCATASMDHVDFVSPTELGESGRPGFLTSSVRLMRRRFSVRRVSPAAADNSSRSRRGSSRSIRNGRRRWIGRRCVVDTGTVARCQTGVCHEP